MEARRRLPAFETRVAQDALLGFAGRPVEVSFLVGAARDAHAPSTAAFLADQDHAVLAALIDRPLRAGRHAARIETMVADPRQVEEYGPVDLLYLEHFLLGGAIEVRNDVCIERRAAQVIHPDRTRRDGANEVTSNHRDRASGGQVDAER